MQNIGKLILVLLLSLSGAAFSNENCQFEFRFSKSQEKFLIETVERTRHKLQSIQYKIQRLDPSKKLELLETFYGKGDLEFYLDVFNWRMKFTADFLAELSLSQFQSVSYARACHLNEDFRTYGLETRGEEIYGAVNLYGKQNIDEDVYIFDDKIYLGKLFFSKKEDQTGTLLHEISHLIGFDEEVVLRDLDASHLHIVVPTQDLRLSFGAPEAISDAYLWESMLEFLEGL